MKKLFMSIFAAISLGQAFSQSTVSTIVVTDTLTVEGRTLLNHLEVGNGATFERIKCLGEAEFKKGITVDSSVSVGGRADVAGGLKVGEEALFNGEVTFSDKVTLESVTHVTNAMNSAILFRSEDGVIQKINTMDFINGFGTLLYTLNCATDTSGNVITPKWNSGTNKLYTSCGPVKVGIGTNSPEYKLDVRGTGYFQNNIRIGTVTPSTETAGSQAMIEVETTSSTAPLMRLSHKSGSNAPQTRFRVENNGELWCTAVRVAWADSIPVPDYVFKPEYKLMPLNEVKSFINTNSHLPNIPSEAEIKKEGLSIEQMQMKLLEKVEELTLYVIDIHEKNEALAKKNAELQKEVEELRKSIQK